MPAGTRFSPSICVSLMTMFVASWKSRRSESASPSELVSRRSGRRSGTRSGSRSDRTVHRRGCPRSGFRLRPRTGRPHPTCRPEPPPGIARQLFPMVLFATVMFGPQHDTHSAEIAAVADQIVVEHELACWAAAHHTMPARKRDHVVLDQTAAGAVRSDSAARVMHMVVMEMKPAHRQRARRDYRRILIRVDPDLVDVPYLRCRGRCCRSTRSRCRSRPIASSGR